MAKKKPCNKCVYYNTSSCVGKDVRNLLMEDYVWDCFTTEEDKALCDLMCGDMENDCYD